MGQEHPALAVLGPAEQQTELVLPVLHMEIMAAEIVRDYRVQAIMVAQAGLPMRYLERLQQVMLEQPPAAVVVRLGMMKAPMIPAQLGQQAALLVAAVTHL